MRAIHPTLGFRGLGAGNILYGSVINTGLGTQADCSSAVQYALNPTCWQMSLSSWQAINNTYMQQTYPNPQAPATAAAPQTQAQMTGGASWTPDQALAATAQNQTQANLAFFNQVQQNVAATQGAAAAGLYDCTKWTQLFTDTSNYFTNCDTTWLWVTGAAIVGLLLVVRK